MGSDDCELELSVNGTHGWYDRGYLLKTRLIDAYRIIPETVLTEFVNQPCRIPQCCRKLIPFDCPCHIGVFTRVDAFSLFCLTSVSRVKLSFGTVSCDIAPYMR